MKDISNLVEKYLTAYRTECQHFKGGGCARAEGCKCLAPAEVMALTQHLVPRSCFGLDLSSFNGNVPGDSSGFSLKPNVVKSAKQKIVEYCWGKTDWNVNTDFSSPTLLKQSVISKRRELGHSLVIHGDSLLGKTSPRTTKAGNTFQLPQVQKVPVGRTLLASVVMKEILRQRLFPGHVADSYEWVSFLVLKSRVTSRDLSAITDYQTADWLVVDGIHLIDKVSDNMRGYQIEQLNAVFADRIENRLPTILVFQFDINNDLRSGTLHEKIGMGLAQIVEDETTLKVCLTNQ